MEDRFMTSSNEITGDPSTPVLASEPVFTHHQILWLYDNDIEIEVEKLREILALPRETLIADLISVLKDSIHRYEYFVNKREADDDFDDSGYYFPLHAVILLGELKATEAFENLIEVLMQDEDFLDFWFDELIYYFYWEALFYTLGDRLDTLQKIILDKDTNHTARSVLLDCVEQTGHHQPERRNEISAWYKAFFSSLEFSGIEKDNTDSEFAGLAVWAVVNLKYDELLPEIERMYMLGYAQERICGKPEVVREEIHKPYDVTDSMDLLDIYGRYSDLQPFYDDSEFENFDELDEPYEEEADTFYSGSEPYIAPVLPGRNDPCICGSGKKFKKCCMSKYEK